MAGNTIKKRLFIISSTFTVAVAAALVKQLGDDGVENYLVSIAPLIYENVNKLLLNNMFMLIGIGLCIVSRLSFNKGVKQYIIALISFTVSLTIPFLLSKLKVLPRLT